MTDLINRLRTGTHEQAVGLLRECWEIIKPEPERPDIPPWDSRWNQAASPQWKEWVTDTSKFERLLSIRTPEACVGAAMMLIPTDGSMNMLEVSLAWEPSDVAVWPAGIVRWYPPHRNGDSWHVRTETASTAALALAAAIMETKNV